MFIEACFAPGPFPSALQVFIYLKSPFGRLYY